MFVKRFGSC